MSALSDALEHGASPARLRALVEAELERGAHELAKRRSGYDERVVVAIGGTDNGRLGAAPAGSPPRGCRPRCAPTRRPSTSAAGCSSPPSSARSSPPGGPASRRATAPGTS